MRCDRIVNAAGLHSDKVAQMIGDFSFKVKPRMGEYILLHKDEGFKANHILFRPASRTARAFSCSRRCGAA